MLGTAEKHKKQTTTLHYTCFNLAECTVHVYLVVACFSCIIRSLFCVMFCLFTYEGQLLSSRGVHSNPGDS